MSLTRYEPLDILNRLQEQFNNLYGVPSGLKDEDSNIITSRWTPAVDVKEDEHAFLIHADIPGVDPKDIEITMENGILSIRGERHEEKAEEREGYKRIERSRGTFYRRFSLPDSADPDRIEASSKHGVLELTIPKREVSKAKKIKVS